MAFLADITRLQASTPSEDEVFRSLTLKGGLDSHAYPVGGRGLWSHPVLTGLAQTSQADPAVAAAAKSLQSCPTLCDPRDGSPPGSTIPGILQARTLEWVAISFSKHESEK